MSDIQIVKLGELLVSLKTGLNPRDNFILNTQDAENWYITVRELNGLGVDFLPQTDRVNNHGLKLINNRSNLEVGDVLFSGTGTIGKTAIIDKHPINWNIKEGVYTLKPNKDRLESYYLMYYLRYLNNLNVFNKISAGSTVFSVPMKSLEEISIQIHKLPEQIKISNVLKAIDFKIALNNHINAELEAMAKTLYDYWFVQFDFPNEHGKPYKSSGGKMIWNEELKREVPVGWEVKNIDEIIPVKDGTHDSPKPKDKGYPLITSKNLKVGGLDFEGANLISEEDYASINIRSKVDTGDILFSMIGSVGDIYKIEEHEINFAIKNVALYKTSQKLEYKNYIYMYLRSCDMQRYMTNMIIGSIQKFLGLGVLRKMPIILNSEFILKYEQYTKNIFFKLNNIKIENQQLSSLRDWLLPMLMNGQVRVE